MAKKYLTENENDKSQHHGRFFDFEADPGIMLMPIQGYEKMPLVSIEKAVEPIRSFIPDIERMVYIAKKKCKRIPDNKLSIDESASLMLYTMEWEPNEECLYVVLNATLRAANRKKLVPWFSFLKLVLTAFDRLPPPSESVVYRGIKRDLTKDYCKGETVVWWAFSSCTSTLDVLENEQFLGLTGARTMFTIQCTTGKDIQKYSSIPSEDEMVLLPARQFQVVSCFKQSGDLYMVQLKEIQPPYPLLQPLVKDIQQISPSISNTSKPIFESMNSLTISENTTKSNEVSEFAPAGEYEDLYCKGHHCAKCGKCRDCIDRVYERFKRRDDAICTYFDFFDDVAGVSVDRRFLDFFLGRDRFFGRSGRFGEFFGFVGHDFCLCDDNRRY